MRVLIQYQAIPNYTMLGNHIAYMAEPGNIKTGDACAPHTSTFAQTPTHARTHAHMHNYMHTYNMTGGRIHPNPP